MDYNPKESKVFNLSESEIKKLPEKLQQQVLKGKKFKTWGFTSRVYGVLKIAQRHDGVGKISASQILVGIYQTYGEVATRQQLFSSIYTLRKRGVAAKDDVNGLYYAKD